MFKSLLLVSRFFPLMLTELSGSVLATALQLGAVQLLLIVDTPSSAARGATLLNTLTRAVIG